MHVMWLKTVNPRLANEPETQKHGSPRTTIRASAEEMLRRKRSTHFFHVILSVAGKWPRIRCLCSHVNMLDGAFENPIKLTNYKRRTVIHVNASDFVLAARRMGEMRRGKLNVGDGREFGGRASHFYLCCTWYAYA